MTFTIESLGCAKNQVDSEELIAHLQRSGLEWVAEAERAEAVIVNTCGFITSAKEESIRTALELKSRFPGKKVLLAGCLVARYGEKLRRALAELDGFVGLRDPRGLERLLLAAEGGSREGRGAPPRAAGPAAGGPLAAASQGAPAGRHLLSYPGSAYLKVAEGCDNRCSYCAIPLIRGPLVSRPLAEVVREARELLEAGVRELVLIAQDLASFGSDRGQGRGQRGRNPRRGCRPAAGVRKAGGGLPRILRELLALPGQFWLRCLYIHPDHFPDELLELAADPRLLPYFDLPFQHACPAVLRRMGRRGSAESYLALLARIREALPRAVLRSTFLVGFPGEGGEDFRRLLDFQRRAELDWAGFFTYSREEGTEAFDLGPRVPEKTAEARRRELEKAQEAITARRLERHVGSVLDVLVEEAVRGQALALGRAYLQAPEVDGLVVLKAAGLQPGRMYRARIERRNGVDLEGSLVRR
jgi:ribosomal protein S12 methylthiotransferase